MISINQIKFVKSLHQKKFRQEHGVYIAEGRKMLAEALSSDATIRVIYSVDESLLSDQIESHHINQSELERISALKTPQDVLFIVEQPTLIDLAALPKGACVALDRVRDPGNMGTIIRTADWFGISAVVCSPDCVEAFNPKVVQATMGSIFRTPLIMADLSATMSLCENRGSQILVADMNGASPSEIAMREDCLILIGNEAQGVSADLVNDHCTRVSIRSFGDAESLNASIACAIICYEHRRSR